MNNNAALAISGVALCLSITTLLAVAKYHDDSQHELRMLNNVVQYNHDKYQEFCASCEDIKLQNELIKRLITHEAEALQAESAHLHEVNERISQVEQTCIRQLDWQRYLRVGAIITNVPAAAGTIPATTP